MNVTRSLVTGVILVAATSVAQADAQAGDLAGDPAAPSPVEAVAVADFGAVPDDGEDDTQAIRDAIAHAVREGVAAVQFEPGVYNLRDSDAGSAMLSLVDVHGLALLGAPGPAGQPATTLEVNLPLENDTDAPGHIHIRNSTDITLENLILDYRPRFTSAGQVVAVDAERDVVVVDILPGMPHFEGMRCYSANSWDLETGDLIPVDALTIGTDHNRFGHTWQRVPDQPGNRYRIEGMGFSDRVAVGQGMSWHFNVDGGHHNLHIMHSKDIVVRNVHVYNSIIMSLLAGYNENMTFEDVHVKPQGNALAAGPRDAFHFSNNHGTLLMDGIHVKGVRWDPIVSRSTFIEVTHVHADGSLDCAYMVGTLTFEPGDKVMFWVGEEPYERTIASAESLGEREDRLAFTEPDLPYVEVGSRLTHSGYEWDEAIIRNSVIEGNFGTSLVLMNRNFLIEDNVFRNNSYSNIGLGPTSRNTGPFARDVVIRGNVFEQSTWIRKYHGANAHDGTITTFQNHGAFDSEPYNRNILIENNVFRNLADREDVAAVHLKNVRQVELRGNEYVNVQNRIKIDPESTRDVVDLDGD